MNLLFVSIHIEKSPRAVPLGSAMLASALKKEFAEEVKVDILDLYADQSAGDCVEMILKSKPQAVGFSMYVWNRDLVLEIAQILKQKNQEAVLFAGGPEASADYEGLLNNDHIDFVLSGEGEESIVPAVRTLLKGDQVQVHSALPAPSAILDLDRLPSPYLDGTIDLADYTGVLWELSRGCPFSCDFCSESRGVSGIRRFSMDRVKAELELFEEAKTDQIFVLDPTFNFDKDAAKEILRLILDRAPDIYYFFEVRSEFIDEEMADLFSAINGSLQIGMQSASSKVLKNINRTIDVDELENNLFLLHERGVAYGLDLIYGLPGDSLEGFCKSLDYAICLAPNHLDIFPLSVLPGTKLHETAPSFGIECQKDNPYRVISTPEFSKKDMKLATELADAADLFYNRGRAVPWFAMVMNAVDMLPSDFFREFGAWSKSRNGVDILELQKGFIADLFEKHEVSELAGKAFDVIAYFGAEEDVDDGKLVLPSGCKASHLVDQLNAGVTDLERLQ